MTKIGPNSAHSPSEHRNSSAGVVTSFRSDRSNVDDSLNDKAVDIKALNNQSVNMDALEQRIELLPEVDTARVVELHSRIMAGEYAVDSERLAGKLLDLESGFEF